MNNKNPEKIELAVMIKELRAELFKAQKEGEGKEVRFTVEDVELELDITVEKQAEKGAAAKFYVLTSNIKGISKNTMTQKLRIKLKPNTETVDPVTGKKKITPTKISGKVKSKK